MAELDIDVVNAVELGIIVEKGLSWNSFKML